MRRSHLLLAAVVVAGTLLRSRGLDWGLPWALHIDERLFVVAKAIRLEASLGGDGPLDPGISSYGILPLWLLVVARQLFLGLATQPGPPVYGSEFAATVLLGRWISAAWSVAAIVLTWRWASRWGRSTGLLAAALVAGFPALVQAAHFGTVESPLVALLVAGLLAAERLAEKPTPARAMMGGIVLGLAVSVKAPGAVLALPLLHAAWPGDVRGRTARAAIVLVLTAAVALALNPLLFAGGGAPAGEHTTLAGNLKRIYLGEFADWTLPYVNDVPVWTELTKLLPYAIGILPELAALAGLVILLRRRAPRDVRLLLVLVPLLVLLLPARVKTIRFLVPALPVLAVCAAEAVRRLGEWRPRAEVPVAAVLGGLALLHGLAFSAIYAREDARVAAARWLDENAGARDIVVVEDPPGYGPPIGSPSRTLVRPALRYEILWRGFYTLHERRGPAERRQHLDRILGRADLLVLSEGHRAEFTASPDLRPVESAFYAALDAGELPFEKVAEFKSYPRLGPLVLPDDGAEVLMRIFDHPRIEIWRRVEES